MNIKLKGLKAELKDQNGDRVKVEIDEIEFKDIGIEKEEVFEFFDMLGDDNINDDFNKYNLYGKKTNDIFSPFDLTHSGYNLNGMSKKKTSGISQIDNYFDDGFEYAVIENDSKLPILDSYKYCVVVYLGNMEQFKNKQKFETFMYEIQRKFEECLTENITVILSRMPLTETINTLTIEEMGKVIYTNIK